MKLTTLTLLVLFFGVTILQNPVKADTIPNGLCGSMDGFLSLKDGYARKGKSKLPDYFTWSKAGWQDNRPSSRCTITRKLEAAFDLEETLINQDMSYSTIQSSLYFLSESKAQKGMIFLSTYLDKNNYTVIESYKNVVLKSNVTVTAWSRKHKYSGKGGYYLDNILVVVFTDSEQFINLSSPYKNDYGIFIVYFDVFPKR